MRCAKGAGRKFKGSTPGRRSGKRLRPVRVLSVCGKEWLIWHRLTGDHARTVKKNELEAFFCLQRDCIQRDALVNEQLKERQAGSI